MIDPCPNCGVDLNGEPIAPEDRHHYSWKQAHYSRKIAVYDWQLDRMVGWECPDCGHKWYQEEE